MRFILVLSLAATLIACDSSSGPKGSWLVGNAEKGVYVFIEDNGNTTDRTYKGVIYSTSDENVLFDGAFDYSKHTPIDINNKNIYSHWDGERLYLKDNSFLKAVK